MKGSERKSKKPKEDKKKDETQGKPLIEERVVHPYTQGSGDNCSF